MYQSKYNFVTHVPTWLLQNGALCDICLMPCVISEMGLFKYEQTNRPYADQYFLVACNQPILLVNINM